MMNYSGSRAEMVKVGRVARCHHGTILWHWQNLLDKVYINDPYDGIRRVSGLLRDLAVSAEDPAPIHTSH